MSVDQITAEALRLSEKEPADLAQEMRAGLTYFRPFLRGDSNGDSGIDIVTGDPVANQLLAGATGSGRATPAILVQPDLLHGHGPVAEEADLHAVHLVDGH